MSNYITVENGTFKREVPTTPLNVGFGSTKGYTYSSTLNNKEMQPDSEFEDITYWTFEEVEPLTLSMLTEYPLEPKDCFTKVEYMTPQEMLGKNIISEEQYINIINNK